TFQLKRFTSLFGSLLCTTSTFLELSSLVQDFCRNLETHLIFTFVEHPQTNGQVEVANKVIFNKLQRQPYNCVVVQSHHPTLLHTRTISTSFTTLMPLSPSKHHGRTLGNHLPPPKVAYHRTTLKYNTRIVPIVLWIDDLVLKHAKLNQIANKFFAK
ncbi:hypothetical protein CR513_09870, partial [Mucuna pruriens]